MPYPSVFIIVDMQNDICHPDGVFAKHGLFSNNIAKIEPSIIEVMEYCKKRKIPIISLQFTVLVDPENKPIGLGVINTFQPFLHKEGCRPQTWGHELLEGLLKPDYVVQKWGISSFYQTTLDKYLIALDAKELILCGFTTNGSVETLAREATGRNYNIITLTDCVTSYSEALHESALLNLQTYGKTLTSKEWKKSYD